MAVLPIQITGEPVLHTPASPVTDFSEDLATLVSDMFETMDADGDRSVILEQVTNGIAVRMAVMSILAGNS